MTELTRLEHEKARLKRELNMWVQNHKKTQARLDKVEERLALLREIILVPSDIDDSGQRTQVRRRSPARKADSDEGETGDWETGDWHEIALEY